MKRTNRHGSGREARRGKRAGSRMQRQHDADPFLTDKLLTKKPVDKQTEIAGKDTKRERITSGKSLVPNAHAQLLTTPDD